MKLYYKKFIVYFFKKNIFLSVAAVLQIAISVLLLNIAFGSVRGTCMQLIFSSKLNDENICVIQPKSELLNDGSVSFNDEETDTYFSSKVESYCKEMDMPAPKLYSEEYYNLINSYDFFVRYLSESGNNLLYIYDNLKKVLNENSVKNDIFAFHSLQFPAEDMNGIIMNEIHFVDNQMADCLNFISSKGKQFSELNNTEEYIEAIIYGDPNINNVIKIGEIKEISVYNYKKHLYEKMRIKIAGILSSPFYLPNSSISFYDDNSVNLDYIFARQSSKDYEGYCGLIVKSFENFDFKTYNASYASGSHMFVNLDNSDIPFSEFELLLSAAGYETVNMHTVWKNSFIQIYSDILSYIIMLLISLVMTILTLSGIALLHSNNNYNIHRTLYILGATYKENVKIATVFLINLLSMGTVLGSGGLLLYRYFQIKKRDTEYFAIIIDKYNVYFTFALFVSLIVIFYILFRVTLRNLRGDRR